MANNLPPQDVLLEILIYDGKNLYWRKRSIKYFSASPRRSAESHMKTWNAKFAGTVALGSKDSAGYKCGSIFGVSLRAHRIIWKMVHGVDPNEVDHINGDPSDNRIENLRNVTHQENGRNVKLHSTNTSGVVGVSWDKNLSKWAAHIHRNNKKKHLGYFKKRQDAIYAREQASIELGFHQNHGAR